ncbi:MAG: hypothetical protein U9N40_07870 [Euryarchaeota archaeon]|nr:hypothetical protein [Euryarchaeota archaeon]
MSKCYLNRMSKQDHIATLPASEEGPAHNTVKKYVLHAQAAREGKIEAIVPQDLENH